MADNEMTREFMANIVRQIAFLSVDDMKAVLLEARASRQRWDSIGSLLKPTEYRDMLYDGTFDHAQLQDEIAAHLISIRERIDKLEAISAKHRGEAT